MQEMDCPKRYLQSLSIEVKRTVQLHHNLPESLHLNQVGLPSLPEILFVDLRHRVSLSLCLSGCGGVLTDTEGSFSSPNHPASYPPNSLCVWVIQVLPPYVVQIHVSSLTVEGPSPCLFDWVEVQEQIEQTSVVTRSAIMKHTFL